MTDVLAVGLRMDDGTPVGWRVLQRVRNAVLVLEVDEADVPVVAARSDLVLRKRPGGGVDVLGDEAALGGLDAGGRLFVSGWRSGSDKQDRPGQGLPWDAPGFSAP